MSVARLIEFMVSTTNAKINIALDFGKNFRMYLIACQSQH